MTGGESDNLVANGVQALQLGGEVDGSRLSGGPALVKSGNTDRVAGGNCAVLLLVVEDKGEHTVEMVRGIGVKFGVLENICCEIGASSAVINGMFSYQRDDDLTIRSGLEVVSLLEVLSNVTMVVDLTVDGENDAVVSVGQGLGSGLCGKIVSCDGFQAPRACDLPTPTILRRSWQRTNTRVRDKSLGSPKAN
jgi:hypothetical protein